MDLVPIRIQSDECPDITVVVVNYNTAHLLDQMFAALEAGRGTLSLQVIVVDNASRDNSLEILRSRYPDVEVIESPSNIGFARANNLALGAARGHYVLLLNTDAFISVDSLKKTISFMDAHPQYGVLGVKLVGVDGSLQPSCRYFPTPWNVFVASAGLSRLFPRVRLVDDMAWDHSSERECDWVPGCFYLVRREVIEHVGLFDPRYFVYYEEVDHCRSVSRAGWKVIYYPFTQVVHIGGQSAATEGSLTRGGRQLLRLQIESELLYFRKHFGIIGVLGAALLTALGDIIVACKGLVQRLDGLQAVEAMRHAGIVLKLLFHTRLASRATR
jgi:N-acetylglucosaminyl-diphospho-decaprenol L-rhamnosyltransferase